MGPINGTRQGVLSLFSSFFSKYPHFAAEPDAQLSLVIYKFMFYFYFFKDVFVTKLTSINIINKHKYINMNI